MAGRLQGLQETFAALKAAVGAHGPAGDACQDLDGVGVVVSNWGD